MRQIQGAEHGSVAEGAVVMAKSGVMPARFLNIGAMSLMIPKVIDIVAWAWETHVQLVTNVMYTRLSWSAIRKIISRNSFARRS